MRLLDAVLAADAGGLWATVLLMPDSPFMDAGRVRAVLAVEYLAQSAAAWFTLQAMQHGGEPRQGMLIACPRLAAGVPHFHAGERLLLRVVPASRLPVRGGGMVKFVGQVFMLPSGEMPVALPGAARAVVDAELSVYL